jgi:hypothetical protein
MTPIKRLFLAIFFAMQLPVLVHAQGPIFNYSVVQDSVPWQELQAQTLINTINVPWEEQYAVGIGFNFPFMGSSFDSVIITKNGGLLFGGQGAYSFIAFQGFSNRTDTNGLHSVLSYDVSGGVGSRICTIQFKNMARASHPREEFSFQLKLYEANGTIAFVSGGLQTPENDQGTEPALLGMYNINQDTPVYGLFATDASGPVQGQELTAVVPEFGFLAVVPLVGKRISFIVNPN